MTSFSNDNSVVMFIHQVTGVSIPLAQRVIRKQFLKEIPELLSFLQLSRVHYFKLKKVYPTQDSDVLSLVAWTLAAIEIDKNMEDMPIHTLKKRRQPKRDYLLNRSSLIKSWLEQGSSIRDISYHLKVKHRTEISPTYIHRIATEMGWKKEAHNEG